jgi:hypothetical protein
METLLVAYGTLLYRESMATTVGREMTAGKRSVPVTVRGFRRLCNVRAAHYQPSCRISQEPIEMGALNVEPAAGAVFNGPAFLVSDDELSLLDRRERWYERRIALLHAFDSDEVIGEGHFYASPPDAAWIERDP